MAAAIMNYAMTAGQSLTRTPATTPAAVANSTSATANAASTSDSNTSTSATVSANDFLTLLVTEMKNQDPTANTDPNEYINQLVNVNSLQQLISINQTLTTGLGSTPASSRGAVASAQATGVQAQTASPGASASPPDALRAAGTKLAPGNLGIPAANPAAQNVAQALSGRPRA